MSKDVAMRFGNLISFITLIFSSLVLIVQGQTNYSTDLLEEGVDLRSSVIENFYLHLDKTSFIRGERVWFKAYIYEQNSQKPSTETSNLHVGLYDELGNEVQRKLIYVENGVGHGDFAIDSTLTESRYFIKAWTNWMKNFNNDNSFYEQIEVLDLSGRGETEITPAKEFSVEFFPEGGSILADTENVVGVQLDGTDLANLENTYASLITEQGDTLIDRVRFNKSGFGKLIYKQEGDQFYELRVDMEGGPSLRKKLPKPSAVGISLMVNTLHPSSINVQLRTNKNTLAEISDQLYRLKIESKDTISYKDISLTSLKRVTQLEKDSLPYGVNRISLQTEKGEIIASRIFFNHRNENPDLLRITSELNTFGDSVEVRLQFNSPSDERFSLSVSALPVETRAYQPANSIKSSFMLSPYIDMDKYDFKPFFEGTPRRQQYELDMLMLAQKIEEEPPGLFFNQFSNDAYEWESGITVKGWAKNADLTTEQSVWMYSPTIQNTFFGELDKDKSFTVQAILYARDSLGFALVNDKGRMRKPDLNFSLQPEPLAEKLTRDEINLARRPGSVGTEQEWIVPLSITDRTIELDEVELVERRRPSRILVSPTTEVRKISDEDVKRRSTVMQYIRKLGFTVRMDYRRDANRYYVTWLSNPEAANYVPIIVDGFASTSSSVLQMPLSQVEAIAYDPQGFISITLKKYRYRSPDDEPLYAQFLIENGFARPSRFQIPPYANFDGSFFTSYGIVDWQPTLVPDDQGVVSFMIPRLEQDEILLNIEGMGSEGTLISESQIIDIN